MNKVIDGRYYDTETAAEISSTDNGYFRNDFNYYEETLYQKQNGDYFLHLIGGANSAIRKRTDGNSYCGSEIIKPISLDEAKKWVEKNCDGKTYIALFGEVE